MNDRIEPDAFREQFAEGADALLDSGARAAFKETTKRGAKQMMTADRVWIIAGIAGAVFLRDRSQRKKIKELLKLSQALALENEFMNAFIRGLMDPSADKTAVLAELTSKLQRLKTVRAL